MTPERWKQVKNLLVEALDRPGAARAAFLDQRCAGDAELRAEVEALLAAHEATHAVVDRPAASWSLGGPGGDADAEEPALERLGPYRVLGVLGRGGMGVVYLAEQDQPRREVALKVLPPGLASARAVRRFEHEAQILGRLQHPGIAQIYEAAAAATPMGPRPFFAMELVRGVPLTAYAEAQGLSVRERAALVADVCDAVQHAHQKGVIHRDLKPANILVDQSGRPKVLDFGVARVIDQDVQTTVQTGVGQLVGTIPYMSPEQVAGDPAEIDTRSDVYALGVVLYELLTGRLPHDASGRSAAELVRAIAQDEPPRLSAAGRILRGDLETIAAKALEKDRARRYQSASDLGEDLRRFLRDEPIIARRASTIYALRKFARRNRALVGGVLAAVVLLVGGVIGTSWQAIRATAAEKRAGDERDEARRARDRADTQAATANEITAFVQSILSSVHPLMAQGQDTTMLRRLLDRASQRVEGELADQPEVAAAVRAMIGKAYFGLGLFDQAAPHLRAALETREGLFGPDDPRTAASLNDLGVLLAETCDLAEAEAMLARALEVRRAVLPAESDELAETLTYLGWARFKRGDLAGAEANLREALTIQRALPAADGARRIETLIGMFALLARRDDFVGAAGLLPDVLAVQGALAEVAGPGVAARAARLNAEALGFVFGRFDSTRAMRFIEEALDLMRRVGGPEHPYLAYFENLGAHAWRLMGDDARAEDMLREALSIQERRLCADHPDLALTLCNLGRLLDDTGRDQEAEPLLRRSLEMRVRLFGPEHPDTAESRAALGCLLSNAGRHDEAIAMLRGALETRRRILDPASSLIAENSADLALALADAGRVGEAADLLREELARQESCLAAEAEGPAPGPLGRLLGTVLGRSGDRTLADTLRGTSYFITVRALVWVLADAGLAAQAERACGDALAFLAGLDPPVPIVAANVRMVLGTIILEDGRPEEAEPVIRRVLRDRRIAGVREDHWSVGEAKNLLGACLAEQGRYEEAEPLLLGGYAIMRDAIGPSAWETRAGLRRIVASYQGWGRPERAAEFRALLDQ